MALGRRHGRRQRGFTLLEALIAAAIFAVILIATSTIYARSQSTYTTIGRALDLQHNARMAINIVVQEIRQAGNFNGNPVDTSAVRIATNDSLSIHGDVDGSGNRYVTYALRDSAGVATSTLLRQSVLDTDAVPLFSGGEVIVENVESIRFTYYDSENGPIPDPVPNPAVYQLDGQTFVTGTNAPTIPAPGTQRDGVRRVRIDLTLADGDQRFTVTSAVTLSNLN